jgi:uncharacterized protein (TIGR04141 family)
LRVVINEIDPDKILKIDTRNLDTTTKQKIELINRNSPLSEFEFDFNEDLLNQIGGKPSHDDYGKSFYGSDSLRLNANLSLTELGDKCRLLLKTFLSENYKNNFPFYDLLKEIKNGSLISTLENNLVEALRKRQQEGISIAYPDINEINEIYEIKIFQGSKSENFDEFDINSVYAFLNNNDGVDLLPEKIFIFGIDSSGQKITTKYTLHDFLVFETDYDKKHYIFTLDRWFQIDSGYYKEIQDSIKQIKEISNEHFLPSLKKNESEGVYNIRAANDKKFLLMDKKDFQADEYTKVEVCDLLTPQKQFICIKNYKSSSTLSHLFNQGLVSASLLSGERKYREFVRGKIPQDWPDPIKIDDLNKKDITFIYAVASKIGGPLINTLPFFSKVSLKFAARNIERLGFSVNLFKIRIED